MSYYKYNQHEQYLAQLPKIIQKAADIKILYNPKDFYQALINAIINARQRIYLIALNLERDQGGQRILEALYNAKKNIPILEIIVLVDWHRAQRGRIGTSNIHTNAEWYYLMAKNNFNIDIPIYGVPVNTREALGVLHLKGFIIDTQVIYSGASLNNIYLHQLDKYRYDRYYIIQNPILANILLKYIKKYLLKTKAVNRINTCAYPKKIINIKNKIRLFRQTLRVANYEYQGEDCLNKLAITALVGLGKYNSLNKAIHHLLCSTKYKLTICTPYFNLPKILMQDLSNLLKSGKHIEIIVGDKTTNDFYVPKEHPFKIISIIPYLYEINLRKFIIKLLYYINNGQLIVRLWKDGNNSYHVKGIWIDKEWQLLTSNNLNPRAWKLDLENALLIHDPTQELYDQYTKELNLIRYHTYIIRHITDLESIIDYPIKISKIIRRIQRIRIDKLISKII